MNIYYILEGPEWGPHVGVVQLKLNMPLIRSVASQLDLLSEKKLILCIMWGCHTCFFPSFFF